MTTLCCFEGVSLLVSDVAASVALYQSLGFTVVQHDLFALVRYGTGTIGLLRASLDAWSPAFAKVSISR